MENDKDLDDWLAGLSGTRPPRGGYDEAATLRKVLLREREDAAADAGKVAPDADVSELTQKRILQRLREEDPEPLRKPARAALRVWAVAASFVFVAFAVTLIWQPWQSGTEITRGVVGGVKIVNPMPDVEARRIVAELQLLGLQATGKNESDRVRIEVTVSAERLPAFGEWMERQGGSARVAGVYAIVIERQP